PSGSNHAIGVESDPTSCRPGRRGGSGRMKSSTRQGSRQAGFWRYWKPALLCTCAGGALGLITVILSAINAISAQQAIAMALPAGVTAIGGQINLLVSDSWTAWRRGFRQGCEAGIRW